MSKKGIILTPSDFSRHFSEVVEAAFVERGFSTFPSAQSFLVKLLEFYVPTANFFDEFDDHGRRTRSTLAETFLRAMSLEPMAKNDLLKRLADRALYTTGFFGDSLQRKLVDVDYYCEMGVTAYNALADLQREDMAVRVYREYASRFVRFSEVLTTISVKARQQDEENILRLYETYAKTGSDLARERLMERGLIAVPLSDLKKPTKQ